MNKPEEYLSQNKYADHENVTKGYIGRLIKEGRLYLIKGWFFFKHKPMVH
jgi:hypothetical protein